MPCFDPRYARRTTFNPVTGKFRVLPFMSVRNAGRLVPDYDEIIPCGNCVGCRLGRSRHWAVRCMHEAQFFMHNTFVTLTYAPEHMPYDGSLDHRDFQLFMKKLRRRAVGFEEFTYFDKLKEKFVSGFPIRNYMCGEYGEALGRPHFHTLLFNFDFLDKVPYKDVNGSTLYNSSFLDDLWGKGFAVIGECNFKTAAYIARYILKKVNGDAADDHYYRYDEDTGQVFLLKPEYTTMSRRPGIARKWFDNFHEEVYPSDEVISDGYPVKPPRYYDSQYEVLYPDDFAVIKQKRKEFALSQKSIDNSTPERLIVREKVKLDAVKQLIRNLG